MRRRPRGIRTWTAAAGLAVAVVAALLPPLGTPAPAHAENNGVGLTPALGATVATLLSALVFGLLHAQYDPLDMSFVFLLGLLLAGVRLKTGSTLLSFGLHALTNLIALAEAAWLISRTGG